MAQDTKKQQIHPNAGGKVKAGAAKPKGGGKGKEEAAEPKDHKSIHPKYEDTTITCLCGNVIHTRSTKQNIRVEICSACHPLFTGKQKFIDSAGRVEKFQKRYAKKK
jgi:large subunit ribosomal protein L31